MADASDSKSDAGNSVWVQVPSPALEHLYYIGFGNQILKGNQKGNQIIWKGVI